MQAKRDEAKARLWAERIAAFERSGLGRRANGATFAYDDRNRLSSIQSTKFDYNGRGERVVKIDPASAPAKNAPVGTSAYLYDGRRPVTPPSIF